MNKNTLTILFLCMSFYASVMGQVVNDECDFATFIPDVEDFCSPNFSFNNVQATASPQPIPSCWTNNSNDNDVWYSFRPTKLSAYIKVVGKTNENVGTMISPQIAVYSGSCGSLAELSCGSNPFNDNVVELTITDLTIGQLYYIRVDARSNNQGSFKLCINTFDPKKTPESDCKDAVVLCDKSELFVEKVIGIGNVTNEVSSGSCISIESASVWYKWVCKDAGTLTFTITPNNTFIDDIDFIVFELPNGIDDCTKKELRCMASGETKGASPETNAPCFGPTGLSLTSNDFIETAGCQSGDDNFVKYIDMVPGKAYALLINNFSETGYGFELEWGGTGTFRGPDVDFEAATFDRFECDKEVGFINSSKSVTDSIVSYLWSFGANSTPSQSTEYNPSNVVYSSFGNKTVALTIETKRGCLVTKSLDFFVKACCKDTSTLAAQARAEDLLCYDGETGLIFASAKNGSPLYQYSIDSINFQPSQKFGALKAGDYEVFVQDSKGCVAKTNIAIGQPSEIIVDAGPSITVELGDIGFLNGSYNGGTGVGNVSWSPIDSIKFPNELSTELKPLRNQIYTLTVEDQNGCIRTDTVSVRVLIVRDVFAPNVIVGPEEGNINSLFNLSVGKSGKEIRRIDIYDRWGNKVYKASNIPINDRSFSWNGEFNGKPVETGVYVWIATVLFIDGEEIIYKGDITVLR